MTRNIKNISSINKTKLNLFYKKCIEEIKEIQRIYKIYFSNKLNQISKDMSDITDEILNVL